MAADQGIRDLYRITGIRDVGTAYVFPKSRLARKKRRKEDEEEADERRENKESASRTEEHKERKGIDIKV